jgi:hypothetical protein
MWSTNHRLMGPGIPTYPSDNILEVIVNQIVQKVLQTRPDTRRTRRAQNNLRAQKPLRKNPRVAVKWRDQHSQPTPHKAHLKMELF